MRRMLLFRGMIPEKRQTFRFIERGDYFPMDSWFMNVIQYVGFGLLGLFALLVVILIVSEQRTKLRSRRSSRRR